MACKRPYKTNQKRPQTEPEIQKGHEKQLPEVDTKSGPKTGAGIGHGGAPRARGLMGDHGPNICIDPHRACWHIKCVLIDCQRFWGFAF